MEEPPVPPVVIPPSVCSYVQAVAGSPLDGADWVYVAKGGGGSAAHGRQVQLPLQGVGEGEQPNRAWKLQVGERAEVVSRDCLKPHMGGWAGPPTCGRPRTASVATVASSSSAEKPGGPV